jgi:putative hydrolase of the HAD superfamily
VDRWRRLESDHFGGYASGRESFAEQRRNRARGVLGRELSDSEADRAFERYLSFYRVGWRLFPDSPGALRRCRLAGLSVGILTNGNECLQLEKIRQMDLARQVDVVVVSGSVRKAKPAPEMFHEACARVGIEPWQALMVGDDVRADIEGAKRAGWQALRLDRLGEAHDSIASLDCIDPPYDRSLSTAYLTSDA